MPGANTIFFIISSKYWFLL